MGERRRSVFDSPRTDGPSWYTADEQLSVAFDHFPRIIWMVQVVLENSRQGNSINTLVTIDSYRMRESDT